MTRSIDSRSVWENRSRDDSLAFLWIRALLGRHWNLHVIRGETEDPHLPAGPVDAVLVVNTFHELTMPESVAEGALLGNARGRQAGGG